MKLKLTIDRNTFIWIKKDKGLIYNSSKFKSFEFIVSRNIRKICESLEALENLYQVILDESCIQDPILKTWINNIIEINSAEIKSFDEDSIPSLKPVLKIQHDITKIAEKKNFTEAINSLKEISIYLNGSEIFKEEDEYHKQIIYPLKSVNTLDIKKIALLLKYIPQKNNIKLNFVGNYHTYTQLKELLAKLDERINTITFYFKIEDVHKQWDSIQLFANKYNIHLICRCTDELSKYIKFCKHNIPHSIYSFLVTSEKDIKLIDSIDTNGIEYTINPLFIGDNEEFFKEYVFINMNDCNKYAIDKRHIFMNQSLNGNFFGQLYVLPDGAIYDNLNFSRLGFVNDDFLEKLLSVFNSNRPWFYIRNQEPCNNCLYQWLCPPPSNYELVMHRPNLCIR